MKLKRNIYIIILSIIIYFIVSFFYENIVIREDLKYVYILDKNVHRGDLVLESDFKKVKISEQQSDRYLTETTTRKYYNDDYPAGYLVLKEMVILSDEYIKTDLDKEILSIKLDLSEDAASYQLGKGSIVNIFYSAKSSDVSEIINSINKETVASNKLNNGYITIKLLDKVKIKNCYDKFGKVVTSPNVIETILVEVSKEESIKINNLKNYGKFSLSIIK